MTTTNQVSVLLLQPQINRHHKNPPENSLMKSCGSQSLLGILLHQHRIILKRHIGQHALERRPAQRIDIFEPVHVEVLTLPKIRMIRLQSAQTGDIDIETRAGIDPACINDIMALSALALP